MKRWIILLWNCITFAAIVLLIAIVVVEGGQMVINLFHK